MSIRTNYFNSLNHVCYLDKLIFTSHRWVKHKIIQRNWSKTLTGGVKRILVAKFNSQGVWVKNIPGGPLSTYASSAVNPLTSSGLIISTIDRLKLIACRFATILHNDGEYLMALTTSHYTVHKYRYAPACHSS